MDGGLPAPRSFESNIFAHFFFGAGQRARCLIDCGFAWPLTYHLSAMPLHPSTTAGLAILMDDSPILDVARDVSRVIRELGLPCAVIGGVAVVLHGHVRTTLDVDVYAADGEGLAAALREAGYAWDAQAMQFVCEGVPVQLVRQPHVPAPPKAYEDIDGIRTVSLADLINIKLRSGLETVLRAQDLADVIGLIRRRQLTGAFTPRIDKDLRSEFRRLLKAVREG